MWTAAAAASDASLRPPPPNRYLGTLPAESVVCFDASGGFTAKPPAPAGPVPSPLGGLHFPSEIARRRVPPKRLLDNPQMRLWHLPAVYHHTPLAQARPSIRHA